MSKRKFYALCQYVDKTDGSLKCGYIFKEGQNVPNEYGIDLAMYKSKEKDGNGKDIVVWHVVDVESGLGLAAGSTKKKASEAVIMVLLTTPTDKIELARRNVREQYGDMPGKKIIFLHDRH